MLKKISLQNVGPIPNTTILFGSRLNIITGDNGLGKSFLLDIIWYILTRKWPAEVNERLTSGYMARPLEPQKTAKITFDLETEKGTKLQDYVATFNREKQGWTGKAGRPYSSGMVIYAHADGSFSVWDPARNYWDKRGNVDIQERQPAFVFSPTEVWDGLLSENGKPLCNGLIQDWAKWQTNQKGWEFLILQSTLKRLSPPEQKLEAGELTRISVDDVRDIPTIRMIYGDVPVLWASAGIRRILAFAYFLTWSLSEHIKACKVLGMSPTPQVTFLIDEVESHLHPKWQRQIMRGLIEVLDKIPAIFSGMKGLELPVLNNQWGARKKNRVQILAATHSALIMSSLENRFDAKQDKWFDFDECENGSISFTERPFLCLGDADTWLTSNAFDLKSTRSIEAEEAIREYNQATLLTDDKRNELIHKLEKVLPDTDPFWRILDFKKTKEGKK